jgi:DNA ligase-1
MKIFPVLYQKNNLGSIQRWKIWVDGTTIYTEYGQADGKLQIIQDTIKEGKNVGKSSGTTPEEQAIREAAAKHQKQVKKGYHENMGAAMRGEVDTSVVQGGIEPMLAPSKIYPHFASKLMWPVYVQPKLDGTRLIAILKDGTCTLWSRTRKQVNSLPHIAKAVEKKLGGHGDLILDGEAFSYAYRNNFEDLISLIRCDAPAPGHEVVDYHIYDLPSCHENFGKRNAVLHGILNETNYSAPLIEVQTLVAKNHEEIMAIHEQNLALEYEGSMIRNDGPYEEGKRSVHLQKLKNFKDDEFPVLRAEEGRGKDTGTIGAFVCVTPKGKEFKARLKATYEHRRHLFENPVEWQGKLLTVKYQNLSNDGIPRFPIGKGLRINNE